MSEEWNGDKRWVTVQVNGLPKLLPAPLVGLMEYLPPQGAVWKRDEMTAWFLLLRVTIQRYYPTAEEREEERARAADAAEVAIREPAGGWA